MDDDGGQPHQLVVEVKATFAAGILPLRHQTAKRMVADHGLAQWALAFLGNQGGAILSCHPAHDESVMNHQSCPLRSTRPSVTDLLPYVDDPEDFARELAALDVPAGQIRHPAVFGPLGRGRPLAVHEAQFVQRICDRPVKVALPGPYLLTRTLWMECISDRAYADREELARDVVRVLREELHFLLAAGVALVQLDEPVLTEVVYGTPREGGRTFMCGALGQRQGAAEELAFGRDLLQEVVAGSPADRLALHVCRGNWTPDETVALADDYRPLIPVLTAVEVGTYMLELATPRAGEMEVLAALPDDRRIGVGVINQKCQATETVDLVLERCHHAIALFGAERVLLNTDCGFATFAENPIVGADLRSQTLSPHPSPRPAAMTPK